MVGLVKLDKKSAQEYYDIINKVIGNNYFIIINYTVMVNNIPIDSNLFENLILSEIVKRIEFSQKIYHDTIQCYYTLNKDRLYEILLEDFKRISPLENYTLREFVKQLRPMYREININEALSN